MLIKTWVFCVSFLFIIISSCRYKEQLPQRDFGKFEKSTDSLSVELIYSQFSNWDELIKRVDEIVCNDSVPKMTLRSNTEVNTIYFHTPCWERHSCLLYFKKNIIRVCNDSIGKPQNVIYPLDSLEGFLKKDIENRGKDPYLSESPDKLIFRVSYDNSRFKNFPQTMAKVVEVYETVTNKTDIYIQLEAMPESE